MAESENADQGIEQAREVLRDGEDWLHARRKEISDKIERGWAQFERGEFLTDEEFRVDLARRKAAWLAERKR